MSVIKQELIKLGNTNPELREHLKVVISALSNPTGREITKDLALEAAKHAEVQLMEAKFELENKRDIAPAISRLEAHFRQAEHRSGEASAKELRKRYLQIGKDLQGLVSDISKLRKDLL